MSNPTFSRRQDKILRQMYSHRHKEEILAVINNLQKGEVPKTWLQCSQRARHRLGIRRYFTPVLGSVLAGA